MPSAAMTVIWACVEAWKVTRVTLLGWDLRRLCPPAYLQLRPQRGKPGISHHHHLSLPTSSSATMPWDSQAGLWHHLGGLGLPGCAAGAAYEPGCGAQSPRRGEAKAPGSCLSYPGIFPIITGSRGLEDSPFRPVSWSSAPDGPGRATHAGNGAGPSPSWLGADRCPGQLLLVTPPPDCRLSPAHPCTSTRWAAFSPPSQPLLPRGPAPRLRAPCVSL